jgi:sodium-dependent dicarboxylate transporter 2/3/5
VGRRTRGFWLAAGPVAAWAVMLLLDLQPGKPGVTRMAGMSVWLAIWWVAEPVPLAVTALVPLVMFPLLGLVSSTELAPVYLDQVSFLFIGGFLVALTIERWGLNQRLALRTLLAFGGTPTRILLGFLTATALISMWMSNTAAALVMLAPALAVIGRLEARDGAEPVRPLAVALLLAVAYGASIGGVGTLVGTPTNLVFVRQLKVFFPHSPELSFLGWLKIGVPLVVVMTLLAWGVLWFLYVRKLTLAPLERRVLAEQYAALGPATYEQKVIMVVATAMTALWVCRSDINFGAFTFPGWSSVRWLQPKMLSDSVVAMAAALVLLLWPSRSERGRPLLTWAEAERLPWGIVILFGGGFALAKGFTASGLDKWLGGQLSGHANLTPLTMALIVSLSLVFLTEFTANTSTVEMVLPVLAVASVALGVNPLFLLLPATLCASFGFMLPAGTPPNAMAFASGRMTVAQMARTGFLLNLTGAVLATVAVLTWGRYALGGDLLQLPTWAR